MDSKLFFSAICFILIPLSLVAQPPDSLNYLPLSIGNRYQYNNEYWSNDWTVQKDSIYPNGKRYFYIHLFEKMRAVRVDSSGNIWTAEQIIPGDKQDEYMLFKADATQGETWVYERNINITGDSCYAQCMFDGYDNIFGKVRRVKMFVLYAGFPVFYHWMAQGIGRIIEMFDDGSKNRLVYAKISGMEYGKPLLVENEENPIPEAFEISQNYPNPFNGSTNIIIDLPRTSPAGLCIFKLYNILGNLVYSETIPVNKSIIFRFNTQGLNLSSGTYFYQVQAEGHSITKKLVLLK